MEYFNFRCKIQLDLPVALLSVCLSVCLSRLTVNVVDLEEELDLVVGTLSGELVHGVDELLQADAPVVVLVEDVKHALHEERLRQKSNQCDVCTLLFYTGVGMEAIEGLHFLASLLLAGTGLTEGGEKTQPFNRFHSRLFSTLWAHRMSHRKWKSA